MFNRDNIAHGESNGTIEAIVHDLDPIVALLSLIHITGDRGLLHKYGPLLEGTQEQKREAFVDFGQQEHKSADPAVVAELRAMLLKEMAANPEPVLRDLDPALFRAMARLALGQDLPEASIEVARQHGGFVTDTRLRPQEMLPPEDFKVVVIGAGMIGINSAIKLKQAGFSYTVLESRHEMGGTWSVNRYPGAAVDTPSILYSYSFDPNPSWSKYYPMKDEYLQYLERVADKRRIRDHIHLNTTMSDATWDEERQLWIIKAIRDGREHVYEANAAILFRKGAAHGYYRHDDSGRIVIATPRHNSTVWHDTRQPKMEHIKSRRRSSEAKPERPAMTMLSI